VFEVLKGLARRTSWYRRRQQRHALAALDRWTPIDQGRLDFYAQLVGAGDIAFDVGANMANRTRILRQLCARVIAIEPQPLCLEVLRKKFAGDPKVVIVDAALGAAPGTARLNIGVSHTLSTLSTDFIRAVKSSGRFAEQRWHDSVEVNVTTLDALIDKHGAPAFIKIDVEGHEEQVLAGLSRPVKTLCFEFVPEQFDVALRCIDRLHQIGTPVFNYVSGENTRFASETWQPRDVFLRERLEPLRTRYDEFGDVYARFDV
jgi:FkbM family methyltransferase